MNSYRNAVIRLIIAVVSLLVSIGLLRSIIGHFRRSDVVGERRETLVKEESRNKQLKDQLQEATSPAFIEKQAREKLGLVRPGDTIILMQSPAPLPSEGQTQETGLTGWKRWWKLFF